MRLPVWKPLYLLMKFCGFPVVWEVSVGAVIYREEPSERRYLLLHYPSGHFDFAKGHVEEGETDEMTLRREVMEETGIRDLEVSSNKVSIRYFYTAKGTEYDKRRAAGKGTIIFKQVHFYPALTSELDVEISHEHIGFVWLPYREAISKVTFGNARRVLEETEAFLKKR